METDGRLRIREWAEEDRPREKMLLKGAVALSDAELLAILISSGNREETVVQLSQRILNSAANNLNALGKLSVKDLMAFKGIGEAKAVTIAAAMELGRRKRDTMPPGRDTIRSSRDVYELFYPVLCDLPYEELWVALTNRAGKVIEKVKVGQGGTGAILVDIRLIMKSAVHALSAGMALCHNHPSGNATPSREDDNLTFRLAEAAGLFDILLLDHIILCDNTYYSYADEDRLHKSTHK
ncbi:MAG: DNA repair protein RadC [Tannerella sp.]|jgi:DNA repair protein RadC|nr:DNA repair protein RadC [Tannerella sp.]